MSFQESEKVQKLACFEMVCNGHVKIQINNLFDSQ